MILDTSAVVALLRNEPEAAQFRKLVEESRQCGISAASYVEASCVVDAARNPLASRRLDELLQDASCQIEPVTERQARIAREAYRDYGKGSGHPAQLNFGDCFAYALAKELNRPLLFKGGDFGHTDVTAAN